ncbi:ABC transporter ATP-binding protein [Clostridia bacterium]|nr:ABC transporter ATP-binding protein [Clostridia bacterium]
MLKLVNIRKIYKLGDIETKALDGVSVSFREKEFVAVLGVSGSGKTTLLNLIGGLDRYTSGDLIINGKSTKAFKASDWDAYRNNSVGFVFQSYNLIPHQTVLTNVELALTLSGVSRSERVARAKNALTRVGLGDQMKKRPNQLSGGQMQRVAIARALINDPDILLADEPTGALDTETSVQVMDLLREIASDRLVIMVTHNPELAERYSTRTIKFSDGKVISDSAPVEENEDVAAKNFSIKRTAMSFFTALSLSAQNLMTKKARTALTAFAGSIGIIGIALILALSNGLQKYIDNMERDTLSSYPITLQNEAMDIGGMLQSFQGESTFERHELDRVYANTFMVKLMNTMMSEVKSNDLAAFKKYIEEHQAEIDEYTTAVRYSYDVPLTLFHTNSDGSYDQVNPSKLFDQFGGTSGSSSMGMFSMGSMTNSDMWSPLIPNTDFVESQYEVLAGKLPEAYDEVVLVINERNEVPDLMLYSLGIKRPEEFNDMLSKLMNGEEVDEEANSYAYDEIMGLEYSLVLPSDVYVKDGEKWIDKSDDEAFMKDLLASSDKVRVVGVARPNPDAAAVSDNVFIGYTAALTEKIVTGLEASAIVREQEADPDTDVFTGLRFVTADEDLFKSMDEVRAYIDGLPELEGQGFAGQLAQAQEMGVPDDQVLAMMNAMMAALRTDATYDGNIKKLGVTSIDNPSSINIYANSFDNKDAVANFISEYNDGMEEGAEITYTDFIGLLLSSVTSVINGISAILIAFVSISLVVSSIMIGIITYISVLERTREIGVLRALGARKRDISRVFNAETLILGFSAGVLGVFVSWLLTFPANALAFKFTEIKNVAVLPVWGAVALVVISMVLTFIAGLLPSRMAANKDPVVALRSE